MNDDNTGISGDQPLSDHVGADAREVTSEERQRLAKMCNCGKPLSAHDREPPFACAETNCKGFSLVIGHGPLGPLPARATGDVLCHCGAPLSLHDKEPPHAYRKGNCPRFVLQQG